MNPGQPGDNPPLYLLSFMILLTKYQSMFVSLWMRNAKIHCCNGLFYKIAFSKVALTIFSDNFFISLLSPSLLKILSLCFVIPVFLVLSSHLYFQVILLFFYTSVLPCFLGSTLASLSLSSHLHNIFFYPCLSPSLSLSLSQVKEGSLVYSECFSPN